MTTRELEELEHQIDLATRVTFAGLPGQTKCEDLVALTRMRNKLDALDASVLSAFEATREHDAQGHSSAIGWLKHNSRCPGKDVARRRRLARWLRTMPRAQAAMVEGAIGFDHVEVLVRAQRLAGDQLFELLEEIFVDTATEDRFGDFVRNVDHVLTQVLPPDERDRDREHHDERTASSSRTIEGCGKIDAWMPPVQFTEWQAELERLLDHLLDHDRAEARARLGRRPLASELPHTVKQRRLDAMHLMAQRSAALDDDPGPSRFALVVHADADTVARLLEALREWIADDDPDAEVDLDLIELGPDTLAELADGTPVTVNTILLALLTGTVRGIHYDPQGEILRFGRERRLFTRAQGDAVRARLRRCCHPYGCDRPPHQTQIDHVAEHRHGGATDVDNAALLCGPHNRWKANTHSTTRPWSARPPDHAQRRTSPDLGPLPTTL